MSSSRVIPFNRPGFSASAFESAREVISSGRLGGDGSVGRRVESRLESLFSAGHALLTTSCSHALEMASMLLRLEPGDEVLLPSFTFVSTANAILRAGGKPVFCEIDANTLTIDPEDVRRRMTPRTRAIIVVHYAGVAAEMDAILDIARQQRVTVIEDAAQGVNATYRGKFLGTIGDCGAYSFHETKNYVCGEGGAFLTNSEELARAAEIVREKGTNRSNFLRGEVDRYTWVDIGSSYVLSDLLAAVLDSQLNDLAPIQGRRQEIYVRYLTGLADLEGAGAVRLPTIPAHCGSNYHIFHVLASSEPERNRLLRELKEAGIQTTFHYVPLHSSPFALEHLGTSSLRLPVTDDCSGRLLRLPIYPSLTDEDVDYVLEQLHHCLRRR